MFQDTDCGVKLSWEGPSKMQGGEKRTLVEEGRGEKHRVSS